MKQTTNILAHSTRVTIFIFFKTFRKVIILNMILIRNRHVTSFLITNSQRMISSNKLLRAVRQSEAETASKEESPRMKEFHEKLKLQPIPRVGPRERFVDLVLVETDPKSGDLIPNTEKDPTKWGDWQNGGRVSDF